MRHPAWFPDWRQEAFDQLQARNDRLEEEYRLGSWERWHYDLPTASLTFSAAGVPKVIAEIQVAGTTSMAAGNWLWAWANSEWDRVIDAGDLSLNGIGWELTAAAARVSNAMGAYRPPRDEGGGLYLLIRRIGWSS